MSERRCRWRSLGLAALALAISGVLVPAGAVPTTAPAAESILPLGDSAPGDAVAEVPRETRGSRTTFGGDVEIPAGTVHRGEIVVIGGSVVVDGEVTREVVVIGGDARIRGDVGGDVVGVLSTLEVGRGTRIGGNLVNVAGSLKDGGADVRGDYVDLGIGLRIPGGLATPFNLLAIVVNWGMLIKLALLFLVIVLLAALVPERIDRLGAEPPARMLLALLVGALFAIVGFPLLILLLLVSVVGILLIPVVLLLYVVMTWLGAAGLFRAFGHKLGRLAGRDLSLLGSMLLGFGVFAVLHALPHLFGLVWAGFTWVSLALLALLWMLMSWIGIGLVLITGMGGPPRPPRIAAPVPAAPATAPAEAQPGSAGGGFGHGHPPPE